MVVGITVHLTFADRAYALARSILHAPDLSLASVDTLHPGLPVPGLLGLPLRWVADGALASTLLQVLAASPPAVCHTWPSTLAGDV